MSFSVENLREYPHLLLNPEYEENMEISLYMTIDEEMIAVCADSDYKNDDSIKYRPKGLPQNTTPIKDFSVQRNCPASQSFFMKATSTG